MRDNNNQVRLSLGKNKLYLFSQKASTFIFAFYFMSFLSVSPSAVEPYDAVYNDGFLTIPKIFVPSYQDNFHVEMELDSSAQFLSLGCSEYCFRLVSAESSAVKSPPFFPSFDGVFANINRLWADGQLYEVSLKLLGEVSGQIYFGLHFADTPRPFLTEPLVLSDDLAKPYYNHACQQEQKARPLPSILIVIPVDLNQDGYKDFIVHYWCGLDDPHYGELQEHQTPDVLVAFVSDATGTYSVQNELVFGERYPALGGASRKYVVGDINKDGVDDFAFAMNWEDGRPGGGDRENASNTARPAVLLSESTGKYQVHRLGERSWGHAVEFVQNSSGGIDAVFAGFWHYRLQGGKPLQAFRYLEGSFRDVSGEYPPPNMPVGWANSFRALPNGTDSYNLGRQIVASSGYSSNLDTGLSLWRETASGWEVSDEYIIKAGPIIKGITWQKTPTEWPIQTVNGKEYVMGGFAEICVMENFNSTDEVYIIAKFSTASFVGSVDFNKIYEQNELLPTQVMVFFRIVDGKLVVIDSPLVGEIERLNSNFYTCADINGDGFSDLFVEVLDNAWISDEFYFGGVPHMYMNDRQGSLVKMGTEAFPNLRTGHATGYLADLNNDGLPDLVLFPQSVRRTEYLVTGTNNDILIYLSRKIIGE
jgi:hypothetical protein